MFGWLLRWFRPADPPLPSLQEAVEAKRKPKLRGRVGAAQHENGGLRLATARPAGSIKVGRIYSAKDDKWYTYEEWKRRTE